MAGLAPDLPDAVVLLLPAPGRGVGELDEELPGGSARASGGASHRSGVGQRTDAARDGVEDVGPTSRCTALSSSP